MKKTILKNILFIFALISGSSFVPCAFATPNNSISQSYTIEIPVADYSDVERNTAFIAAYKQTITNFSGNEKSANRPSVKAKLKNIANWVQSYNYIKRVDTTNKQQLFLQVRFDESSIPNDIQQGSDDKQEKQLPHDIKDINDSNDHDIQEPAADFLDHDALPQKTPNNKNSNGNSNQPIPTTIAPKTTDTLKTLTADTTAATPTNNTNNQNIPALLVWLVAMGEDPQQNIFVDDTSNNTFVRSLKTAAKNYGIKIILPAMDIEDLTQITADDVCNLDGKIIKAAAKRYGVNNIVAGCISGSGNNQHSEWLLLTNSKNLKWNFEAQDSNRIITQSISKIAEILNPQNKTPAPTITQTNTSITSTSQNTTKIPTPATPDTKIKPNTNTTTASISQIQTTPVTQTTKPEQQPIVTTTTTAPSSQPATIPPETTITTTSAPTPIPTAVDTGTSTTTTTTTTPPTEDLSTDQTIIYVTNVADLDQYAAVVKYLHALPKVSKIELQNINAATVKLKITVPGGKDALASTLKSQRQLIPNTTNTETAGDTNSLSYNWQPKPTNPNM